MTKEQLIENLYEIITNNTEELKNEDGANMCLSDDNKIYIELNDNGKMFVLSIEEVK